MSGPRVVFDCNTFVQALANAEGPAGVCWALARSGHVTLCVSEATLAELGEVLRRPKLARKLGFTEEIVAAFLEELGRVAEKVGEVPKRFTYPRDPKDEPYVDLALAATASHVVSRDRDLLDLMNDTDPDGKVLRALNPGLRVLDPVAFLNLFVRPPPAPGEGLP
jgi:uncharacterized protein